LRPSELQRLQLKQFKALLNYAYENVAFYHKKFRAAGFKPDDFNGFKDLKKVPSITKFEVQEFDLRDVVARNVDLGSLINRTTSGSTGVPLAILVDSSVEDFESAVWLRAMFDDGFRFKDRLAVVTDPRSFPKKKNAFQRFGIVKRRYISIFDSVEKQIASLKEFKPDVIRGYASSLSILARGLKDFVKEFKLRLIISTAELLDQQSKKFISSVFGAELFDFYACSEFGLLAWECKEHNGYHVNADAVLMEFVDDDGEAVAPEERGEIVCTSLYNSIMPLIRYRLEDVGIPSEDQCSCGRTLPLMRLIEGRKDDFLTTTDGRLISPTVFFPYPFENTNWIKWFRVIQESRKKLVIQVVVKEDSTVSDLILEVAMRKIHELFGEDMRLKFEFVDEIPQDNSGKLRKVISHVNGQTKICVGC